MSSSTPVGTSVQGGGEVPGEVDVDALGRRFEIVTDPDHDYIEDDDDLLSVAEDALAALRQQQEALKGDTPDLVYQRNKQLLKENTRLRAVIEEVRPRLEEGFQAAKKAGIESEGGRHAWGYIYTASQILRKALENKDD